MIRLSAECEALVRREGERAFPNECCGVLLGPLLDGDGRQVEAVLPIENNREAEEQYHRFRIEAEDLMRAEKEARKQNREVLGFYHSHPDHPARPSEYDREFALPFYSYIILGVEGGRAAELTSWRLTEDRSVFNKEELLCR
ncbi:Mov34/MPN/PAD-1 family protein [Leadbettera azotonutricia]|uniref:Mov34/MPN/PAD-1 n=1 Tax=Leadbettera azotonutricia (strain ATCC BAA-888 / DSM 13862 / ZAS-9) TaxID=545695 RepID=F5YDE0_LEAAZ|nr:M67 family metallopeptidase [Leadbettera azotonutricia]AEF83075.1 Mov34/MPN/PAD-1 [Leadbettera azotonutricia ZAS-9]